MKKTLKIKEHLTNINIYVCYGNEEYLKTAKKLKLEINEDLNCNGIAHEFRFVTDNSVSCYFIGLNDTHSNVYTFKSTIVHELNHIVTMLMDNYGFKCDEFRSYLLSYLYEKTMIWIDRILRDNQI